jgi:hypothetical protein
VTRNDKGAEVPRGELGVEGISGKVHCGNVDEVTDFEGGLAMHGSSMALGAVGSIIHEMATGQVKARGMMLVEVVHFGWGAR